MSSAGRVAHRPVTPPGRSGSCPADPSTGRLPPRRFGRCIHASPVFLRAPCLLAVLLMALATQPVHAQQYRSEVREVAPPAAQQKSVDPQTLLKSTTDPYARALLLRDLAAGAVQKKDYVEAQRLLSEALGLDALSGPAAERMRKDLAALALATGDLKDQVPQLEALVKAGNATPEVQVALGAAYLENKRYKDAVPLLRKGIAASDKPDPSWRRALIAALIGAGQYAQAATALEQMLRLDASQADAWRQLAALYLRAGKTARAQATIRLPRMSSWRSEPSSVSVTMKAPSSLTTGPIEEST